MQVGYGDVVAISTGGKLAIVAIICVGVVLIPVQTSQLYQQLVARRVTQGAVPVLLLPCTDRHTTTQVSADKGLARRTCAASAQLSGALHIGAEPVGLCCRQHSHPAHAHGAAVHAADGGQGLQRLLFRVEHGAVPGVFCAAPKHL